MKRSTVIWVCLLAFTPWEFIGLLRSAPPQLINTEVVATNAFDYDGLAKHQIEAMQAAGTLTNVINLLVSDGTFCRVRGHQWGLGCGMVGCLVNHAGPTRHCTVCGLMQTQRQGPWE